MKAKPKKQDRESEIVEALGELSQIERQILSNDDKHQRLVEKLLTPEIRKKLERLDKELAEHNGPLMEDGTKLRKEIGGMVGEWGASVETDDYLAVFIKPSVKWNAEKLEGFAMAYPEILGAKTVARHGSCQIRPKKEKED